VKEEFVFSEDIDNDSVLRSSYTTNCADCERYSRVVCSLTCSLKASPELYWELKAVVLLEICTSDYFRFSYLANCQTTHVSVLITRTLNNACLPFLAHIGADCVLPSVTIHSSELLTFSYPIKFPCPPTEIQLFLPKTCIFSLNKCSLSEQCNIR
jgi:hypothetical protein